MIVEGISGVPKYECTQYQEKHSDYCVLIPIINEGERIAKELERAKKAGIDQIATTEPV